MFVVRRAEKRSAFRRHVFDALPTGFMFARSFLELRTWLHFHTAEGAALFRPTDLPS
jgi:hypothetical protein